MTFATTAVSATYAAATDILRYGRDGIVAVGRTTGEAAWEMTYALGFNTVPAAHPVIVDPLPARMADRTGIGTPTAAAAIRPAAALPPPGSPAPSGFDTDGAMQTADAGLLANFIYDSAQRRPDGSYFVPKPLQRLFGVRTRAVSAGDRPMTFALPGRIVADPHAHGHVEASLLGRFAAPPAGLPVLGDVVTKGQILGFVAPALGVVDRTAMRREVARLTTEIRVETEGMERLKQFFFVPFRDGKIYQSEIRIEGLRRERAALLPMLETQEVLRAPTDGVVSATTAVEGGVVHPGETIFDIVDPTRLWIEAVAPETAGFDSGSIAAASAATPEGLRLQISYVGSGLMLRQQAAPVLFRIDHPAPGLRLDRPVTITAQSRLTEHGMMLPKTAITIGSDGVAEVWEQTAAESFVPHPVRVHDLDSDSVLVVDGLTAGARIVSGGGARLMAQLQ